jgi:histidinol-phosphate/aromatic aminotransferase/cobyric acid decarboxylase-like protein
MSCTNHQDFAMAGIRVGTLYTENTDLMEALSQLANLHGVPGSTQHQMAQLLQDRGERPLVARSPHT